MERKLTAILSADVKGYSRLMGEDEEATIRTLTAYRQVMTTLIQQHRGRVVDSPGDNLLAEFASAVDAVRCAVEVQHELKVRNAELPDQYKMEFRIGLNVGDVIVEGERIYGDGVNIAARLEGLAEPSGICISGTVYDQIENKLALSYEYLGEQTVKNIAKPVRAWRVVLEPAAAAPLVGAALRGRPEPPFPGQPQGVAPTTSQNRRLAAAHLTRTTLVAVGLLIIGGIVTLLYPFLPPLVTRHSSLVTQPEPALALPDKPSIAVLPFVNMSEDPKQEYFSDGMTEDLITDLSKLSDLFVIARNSVFTYKGKAVDVEEVSRKLGVRYVLEGSVRKADNRVRVTAQLVDATTGGHLWAERYDRELKDIFTLQDEIVQKIVAALAVKLAEGEQERLVRRYTGNLEAYDYFLRGKEYFSRFTKEANAQARQMFEKAVELDSKYAAAYAALGWIHLTDWTWQWSHDPQSLDQAFELAQKAVALDDSLPLAHAVLGQVYLWKNRQHEQAIAEVERAIALDPNDADSYVALAHILSFTERRKEAVGLMEKAMRLNPHYPAFYLFTLGFAYCETGRSEAAIAAQKRALTRNPDLLWAHVCLAACSGSLGQEEKARAEVAEVLRLNPNFSLEVYMQTSPFKDQPEAEKHMHDALRRAGLK